tara:strand:+ start:498 stop:815 length:318 start_codon:yes stop_codon:yes gene_type:complete
MTEFAYVKLPADGATPRQTAFAVNLLIDGKSNNTASFTLAASTTTTTVTDFRVGPDSVIVFTPMTANAAGAFSSMFVSARATESFTVTHASNSQTDKTFTYIVVG